MTLSAIVSPSILDRLVGKPLPSGLCLRSPDREGGLEDFGLTSGWVVLAMMPGPSLRGADLPPGYMEATGAPGCTAACTGLNRLCPGFPTAGTKVVVVTGQTVETQQEVREMRGWPNVTMLSDPTHSLADALGLPQLVFPDRGSYHPRVTLFVRDGVIREALSLMPNTHEEVVSRRLTQMIAEEHCSGSALDDFAAKGGEMA